MASRAKEFCTCTDLACPLNPANHDDGCDMCVKKNLALNEVPVCFFKKMTTDPERISRGTTFEDFAGLVRETKAESGGDGPERRS